MSTSDNENGDVSLFALVQPSVLSESAPALSWAVYNAWFVVPPVVDVHAVAPSLVGAAVIVTTVLNEKGAVRFTRWFGVADDDGAVADVAGGVDLPQAVRRGVQTSDRPSVATIGRRVGRDVLRREQREVRRPVVGVHDVAMSATATADASDRSSTA